MKDINAANLRVGNFIRLMSDSVIAAEVMSVKTGINDKWTNTVNATEVQVLTQRGRTDLWLKEGRVVQLLEPNEYDAETHRVVIS